MNRRDQWREHCLTSLREHDVNVIELPHGFRLIGLYSDLTLTDIADLTPRELERFSAIRPLDRIAT